MGRFQSCKGVLERYLRRAFYDGVLELYDGHGSADTVTAVTLEGTLTLTINKAETILIRLNEVAQRAEEVSLEQEDPPKDGEDHHSKPSSDKEESECPSPKKRKPDEADNKKDVVQKKLKTENACIQLQDTKKEIFPIDYAMKSSREDQSVSQHSDEKKTAEKSKMVTPKVEKGTEDVNTGKVTERASPAEKTAETVVSPEIGGLVHIKREPEDLSMDLSTRGVSPGPAAPAPSTTTSSHLRTLLEEAARERKTEASFPASPKPYDLSFSVEVKKEPKVESILIEDDDDDDDNDDAYESSRRRYGSGMMQQASPLHSLWYGRSQGSSRSHHQSSSHHRSFSDREQRSRRSYTASPQDVEAAGGDSHSNQHQVSMLLERERNDCPLCGEVLHSRQELGQHLHRHRHILQASCAVCRTNTLTLDALLLHLSTVHGPPSSRLLHHPAVVPPPPPLTSSAVTSDSVLSQALMPALPYPPSPMSAIASLVSMAACQAGGASAAAAAAFLAPSLMEQLMTYRGMLPCPVCQLLCSSRQHLTAHLALVHGDLMRGGGGEADEDGDGIGSESRDGGGEDLEDGSGDGINFSCFDCSQVFSSQAAFSQHCLLSHNSTSAVSQGSCSVCHRAFHTWKSLHAHYLSAHAVTNFCQRCKMGFGTSAELRTHYDSSHGGMETRSLTYICDICNKGFYSQSQCSAHKRSHISEKSFACQVCGSAFFKRGDLSKHFRTVHAPNRVFACRFCGKRGTRMDNMRSHVKSHGKHMTRDEVLSFIEEVSPQG